MGGIDSEFFRKECRGARKSKSLSLANKDIINIAEGREPELESEGDPGSKPPGLAVRHTLKVILRNTLPQMDVHFHQ